MKEKYAQILAFTPTILLIICEVVYSLYYIFTDVLLPYPKLENVVVIFALVGTILAFVNLKYSGLIWFWVSILCIPGGILLWTITKIVFFFILISIGGLGI